MRQRPHTNGRGSSPERPCTRIIPSLLAAAMLMRWRRSNAVGRISLIFGSSRNSRFDCWAKRGHRQPKSDFGRSIKPLNITLCYNLARLAIALSRIRHAVHCVLTYSLLRVLLYHAAGTVATCLLSTPQQATVNRMSTMLRISLRLYSSAQLQMRTTRTR